MLICKQPAGAGSGAPDRSAGEPAPFVVGVTRSGTTLLRMMLDSHPALAVPPETHFIPELLAACGQHDDRRAAFVRTLLAHPRWNDFHVDGVELSERLRLVEPFEAGPGLRAFYALYAERFGKPRWGDKTPAYVYHMLLIQQVLPEARFVHIIRDGRDAALSIKDRSFGPSSIEAAARLWVERLQSARSQLPGLGHYLEIRYEDLVLESEMTLRSVCRFLELSWDASMLRYHERAAIRLKEIDRPVTDREGNAIVSAEERIAVHALLTEPPCPERVGRWRREMSAGQRLEFELIAAPLLREFGYEV